MKYHKLIAATILAISGPALSMAIEPPPDPYANPAPVLVQRNPMESRVDMTIIDIKPSGPVPFAVVYRHDAVTRTWSASLLNK